jgi:hypothetical protein
MAVKVSTTRALVVLMVSTVATGCLYWHYMTRGDWWHAGIATFGFWGGSLGASICAPSMKQRRTIMKAGMFGVIPATGYAIWDQSNFYDLVLNVAVLAGAVFLTRTLLQATPLSGPVVKP